MTSVQTSTSIVSNGSPQQLCFDACQPEITCVNSIEKQHFYPFTSPLRLDYFFCCYDTSSLGRGCQLTAADARRAASCGSVWSGDKSGPFLSGCKQIKSWWHVERTAAHWEICRTTSSKCSQHTSAEFCPLMKYFVSLMILLILPKQGENFLSRAPAWSNNTGWKVNPVNPSLLVTTEHFNIFIIHLVHNLRCSKNWGQTLLLTYSESLHELRKLAIEANIQTQHQGLVELASQTEAEQAAV